MYDPRLQARRAKLRNDILEFRKFLFCQSVVCKGAVEMRIDPADGKVLHLAVKGDHPLRFRGQKTVAPHAGVDLNMHLGNVRPLPREGIDHLCRLPRADGEDHVQIEQTVQRLAVGDGAEH